jgi:rhodanese-related sulfurtransferase
MKRFWNISLLTMLVLALFTGCAKDDDDDDDDDPVVNAAFQLMIDYLEGDGGNYFTNTAARVIGASTVWDNLDADPDHYTILDVRTGDYYGPGTSGPNGTLDFDEGHIPGAFNVSYKEVVTYCEDNAVTGPILVYCYTGHTAGYSVAALNLMGYEAYSMSFGFSSWNADFDMWTASTGSDYIADFVTDAAPALPVDGDSPVITTTLETGEAIFAEQLAATMVEGFQGVTAADLMANPDDYYIVNYFGSDDYLGLGGCPDGHIDGAYQYTPNLSLQTTEDIYTLPTDKTIAVYCWTGQHGSQVTLLLNMLGYDAKDVKFGVNGMVYENVTAHRWAGSADYEYVISEPEATEFETLTEYLEAGDNYVNNLGSWIVSYASIDIADYFILDLRTADDYNDVDNLYDMDHLDNAVNATLATMLVEVEGVTDDILVVCYTGHSASYAHMLLRLLGYNAYVLKWGMSGVVEEHDRWTTNTSNEFAGDFVTDAAPELPTYGFPELATGFDTGLDILAAKIGDAIELGFPGVTAATVMVDPTIYNVVNYWGLTDYDFFGHIVGALQVTPNTLTVAENLSAFSPDTPNVIYCWTGQTGAAVAAYMTVLGYDIVDLKFGANAMIYDALVAADVHFWPGW